MTWQIYTLISVLTLSISVILQRILIHKDKVDPYAYAALFQGIVGVLLTAFALARGFSLPNFDGLILPAAVSIVCFGVGNILYAKTLQRVEASAFSVLFATQAVWTMLLGIILLGESLTSLQVVGTALIFISVAALAKHIRKVFSDKGTVLGLLTGLLFGVAIYYWSYVGRHTDGLSWAAISFVFTALTVVAIRPKAVYQVRPLLQPKVLSKLVLLGVFYGTGSATMLFAYKYGSFAVVSPLRQTSIIVTVLLALALLPNERSGLRKKLFAAALCTLGVILIVV